MLKTLFLILTIVACAQLHAQLEDKRNTTYIELGGGGGFTSINYERILNKEGDIIIRSGLGMYTEYGFYLGLPLSVHYLFELKQPNSYIDVSLGGLWLFSEAEIFKQNEEHFFSFVPSVGFRKLFGKNGFYRVAATPIINENGFVPWIGVAIGKRF